MRKPALSITLLGGFAVARDEAVIPPGAWRLRKGADLPPSLGRLRTPLASR